MDKKIIIDLILITIAALATIYFWKKGKKEQILLLASSVLVNLIQEAENQIVGTKKGQERLNSVLEKYDKFLLSLTPMTRFFLRIFLPKKNIPGLIEKLFSTLKSKFKSESLAEAEGIKNIIGKVTDDLINSAINKTESGLIKNNQLIDIGEELKLTQEDRGYVKGFIQAKSDLKENHEVLAGISAGVKF